MTNKIDDVQEVSPLNPAVQDAEWQKQYEERRKERKGVKRGGRINLTRIYHECGSGCTHNSNWDQRVKNSIKQEKS